MFPKGNIENNRKPGRGVRRWVSMLADLSEEVSAGPVTSSSWPPRKPIENRVPGRGVRRWVLKWLFPKGILIIVCAFWWIFVNSGDLDIWRCGACGRCGTCGTSGHLEDLEHVERVDILAAKHVESHFPLHFLWFSYVFPMVFLWKAWGNIGKHRET